MQELSPTLQAIVGQAELLRLHRQGGLDKRWYVVMRSLVAASLVALADLVIGAPGAASDATR